MNLGSTGLHSTVLLGVLFFTVLAALDYMNLFDSYRSLEDFTQNLIGNPSTRITICAMESNTPNILEWIEYHRLQGVDKFSLYYPASINTQGLNSLNNLQSLYRTQGYPDLLEVLPSMGSNPDFQRYLFNNSISENTQEDFRHQQKANYVHCLNRNRKKSQWVAFIDTDEYLVAPQSDNVWDYVKSQRFEFGIHARMITFGPSGNMWNFQMKLHVDPETSMTQVLFDPRDNAEFRFHKNGRVLKSDPDLKTKFELRDDVDEFRIQEFDDIRELVEKQKAEEDVEEVLQRSLEKRYNRAFNGRKAPLSPSQIKFLPEEERSQMTKPKDWVHYFPLIVEDQVRAMPTFLPQNKKSELALRFLPHCAQEVKKYHEKLKMKIGDKPKLPTECGGTLPRGFTKMGKSMYNTRWSNFKAERLLGWGDIGCLRPWCHLCSDSKGVARPQPQTLQLHHHQFLSFQQRTFGARSFQKNTIQSKFKTKSFAELLELQSSVYSDPKKKFAKLIRKQLESYAIQPVYFDVSMAGQRIVSDGVTALKNV